MDRIIEVVFQQGQHAILYGERGVGKSSLANVVKERVFATPKSFQTIKRNCTTNHTFKLIWQHLFSDYSYEGIPAPEWIEKHSNPFDIYRLVEGLSADTYPILIIDEFDRVQDQSTKVHMADTIKYLSDYGSKATLIVVGVASTVSDLFSGHESISRNVAQLQMPRMDPGELMQIIETRLDLLQMKMAPEVKKNLVSLSQGLPGYTHLMGQAASRSAIKRKALWVEEQDFDHAIKSAIETSDDSMKAAYAKAIRSTKPQNQYRQALLACALAHTDDRGFFNAGAIRQPFSEILGREVDIPNFSRHLKEFCDLARGPALVKEGRPRTFEYRFHDPLLRPYVVIRGVAEGMIRKDQVAS